MGTFLWDHGIAILKRNELASAVWKATAGRVPLRDVLDHYWLAFWLDARCAFSSDKGKNERPHGQIVGEGNGRGSSVGNTQGSDPESGGVWNRPANQREIAASLPTLPPRSRGSRAEPDGADSAAVGGAAA